MTYRRILIVALAVLIPAAGLWMLGSILLCEGSLRIQRPGVRTKLEAMAARDASGTWREVSIHARDGVRLDAYLIQPRDAARDGGACVVVLHGIRDSRSHGAAGFVPMFAGYTVLLPDIRGHGTSGGDLMTFGVKEKEDLLGWVGWLRAQARCKRVYGLGESLGGAILIQAAALDPTAFDSIVAECPFTDLPSIAEYRVAQIVPAWAAKPLVTGSLLYAKLRYGLDLSEASPLAAIGKVRTPTLLIHGLADTATPADNSRRLAATGKAALWLVPAARHVSAYATEPKEFRERVLKWFERPAH